jgi:hypothetical protein
MGRIGNVILEDRWNIFLNAVNRIPSKRSWVTYTSGKYP